MPATSSSTSTSSPSSPLLPSSPAFVGWFRSVYILVPTQLPPPPLLVVASTSALCRLDLNIVIKFSKPPLSHRHWTSEGYEEIHGEIAFVYLVLISQLGYEEIHGEIVMWVQTQVCREWEGKAVGFLNSWVVLGKDGGVRQVKN